MALRVDKWVAAGIEAVKWSKLADSTNASDMATWCNFFDFYVAAAWIDNNPESYELALREGFETISPLTQAELEHTRMHIAVTLTEQADELMPRVNSRTADRIRAIVADQMPSERQVVRSTGTSLSWLGHAAG